MKSKLLKNSFISQFNMSLIGLALVLTYSSIFILLSPLYLYRFILCKAAKFLSPTMGEIVHARGQFFATEEFTKGPPRSTLVISGALRGHLTLEEVRHQFLHHLVLARDDAGGLKYPELLQYITSYYGFSFWKPEESFDINDHVNLYQSSKGPSSQFTDDDQRELMETLMNEPFKPKQSPWEIFVTNHYVNTEISTEEMTLITAKIHHCLSDGFGLTHTIFENLGNGPPSVPKPIGARSSVLIKLWQCACFPGEALITLTKFAMLAFKPHPWKTPDNMKKWKQNYWKSQKIPINQIKAIKRKFNVNFSSVLLSAYSAAASNISIGMRSDDTYFLGSHTPCVTVIPLPDHPKTFRNNCTAAYLYLPTSTMDPIQRLLECEKQIASVKNSYVQPILGKYLTLLVGSLPIVICKFMAKNHQFPIGLSNFPISEKRMQYVGREALGVSIAAGGQQGVLGVNFFVHSYGGHVEFAVTAEDAIFSHKDLAEFISRVTDEVDFLYNAVV